MKKLIKGLVFVSLNFISLIFLFIFEGAILAPFLGYQEKTTQSDDFTNEGFAILVFIVLGVLPLFFVYNLFIAGLIFSSKDFNSFSSNFGEQLRNFWLFRISIGFILTIIISINSKYWDDLSGLALLLFIVTDLLIISSIISIVMTLKKKNKQSKKLKSKSEVEKGEFKINELYLFLSAFAISILPGYLLSQIIMWLFNNVLIWDSMPRSGINLFVNLPSIFIVLIINLELQKKFGTKLVTIAFFIISVSIFLLSFID